MRGLSIDLNADLGEGCGADDAMMTLISSCNIACGGHAGTAETVRDAMTSARGNGVAIGAHPSYPDKKHFGRRSLTMAHDALEQSLHEQLGLFGRLASELRIPVRHIKPHGALYHDLSTDPSLAELFLRAAERCFPGAAIVAMAGSTFHDRSAARGIKTIAEGFADRRYRQDGGLMPRSEPTAVIENPDDQARQALSLATGQPLASADGAAYSLSVQTICIHGDTPGALDAARHVCKTLKEAGLTIAAT